ncbi:MAG TPA: hypothetical protein VMV69_06990 [Pirellulales bacterium]|nr:hypothetical protein [Pirellulales bacterium]
MAKCLICLSPADGASTYHRRCLKRLFGAPSLPQFDLDRHRLTSIALDMAAISLPSRWMAARTA